MFVFHTKNQLKSDGKKEFLKFFLVRVISLALDNVLFYMLVDVFDFNVYFSRISLSIVIIWVTFLINKNYVFSQR